MNTRSNKLTDIHRLTEVKKQQAQLCIKVKTQQLWRTSVRDEAHSNKAWGSASCDSSHIVASHVLDELFGESDVAVTLSAAQLMSLLNLNQVSV